MLDLGWSEILVIGIVLIVVVGPKDLPRVLRSFGRTTSKLRSMAGDFRKQFDDALKEAELDEFKTLADDARKLNPAREIRRSLSPMEQAAKDVRAGLDKAMKPKPMADEKPAADARPAEPLKAGATAPSRNGAGESETTAKPAEVKATPKPASARSTKSAASAKPKAPAAAGRTAKAAPPRKRASTRKAASSATKAGKTGGEKT
jgi:sec-independent protein translocase protein TatB